MYYGKYTNESEASNSDLLQKGFAKSHHVDPFVPSALKECQYDYNMWLNKWFKQIFKQLFMFVDDGFNTVFEHYINQVSTHFSSLLLAETQFLGIVKKYSPVCYDLALVDWIAKQAMHREKLKTFSAPAFATLDHEDFQKTQFKLSSNLFVIESNIALDQIYTSCVKGNVSKGTELLPMPAQDFEVGRIVYGSVASLYALDGLKREFTPELESHKNYFALMTSLAGLKIVRLNTEEMILLNSLASGALVENIPPACQEYIPHWIRLKMITGFDLHNPIC